MTRTAPRIQNSNSLSLERINRTSLKPKLAKKGAILFFSVPMPKALHVLNALGQSTQDEKYKFHCFLALTPNIYIWTDFSHIWGIV